MKDLYYAGNENNLELIVNEIRQRDYLFLNKADAEEALTARKNIRRQDMEDDGCKDSDIDKCIGTYHVWKISFELE